MGRHKKIPTKNRKKLKACDPFNTRVTSWKLGNKKKKNWVPKTDDMDQPLTSNLRDLQESMKQGPSDGSFPKKRGVQKKNRAVLAAEKMGIYKRRFEDMRSFMRRVENHTFSAIQDHKIRMEQGTAARPQSEIDEEMKFLEKKEQAQKDQKKREIQNQIQKAKKERAAHAKHLKEKLQAKAARQARRRREEEEEEPEEEERQEDVDAPEGSEEEEDEGEEEEEAEEEPKRKKKQEKKLPIFGVPKKPAVNEAIIHRQEKVAFGERYDEPPKFGGRLKDKLDPLTAKAGGKNLLLHSMLKKSSTEGATYLDRDDKQRPAKEFERQRVIEAYRDMKKRKPTGVAS